jgi:hypothetical protein
MSLVVTVTENGVIYSAAAIERRTAETIGRT